MRLIGAALPRTGTMSLSHALRDLTGAPVYHMTEFFHRPQDAPTWAAAMRGEDVDWRTFLADYAAGVDTPLCVFWREIAETFPDARILLTHRKDAQTWWSSIEATVLPHMREMQQIVAEGDISVEDLPRWAREADPGDREALVEVFAGLGQKLLGSAEAVDDPAAGQAAYERWLDDVRREVPPERLVEWQPGDGWEPLCEALGVPVPDEEFPHDNSREDFVARQAEHDSAPPRPGAHD